jgi:hypothetical protein
MRAFDRARRVLYRPHPMTEPRPDPLNEPARATTNLHPDPRASRPAP